MRMTRDRFDDSSGRSAGEFLLTPAGWRVLVPGLPHWHWQQHDQALVFFLFHLGAMSLGLFLWGTWLSLLMIGFAFVAHAVSAADAIKQAAFPKFGPMVPLWAALLGLGAVCYAPLMGLGSMFAWPVVANSRTKEAYWVNRWAYRGELGPQHGETIWLQGSQWAYPRLARVLAGQGQRVRWSSNRLQIDDRPASTGSFRPNGISHALELTVPDEHVLVSFVDDLNELIGDVSSWEIVAHEEVHGRAWAQSYPVWDRQLLW